MTPYFKNGSTMSFKELPKEVTIMKGKTFREISKEIGYEQFHEVMHNMYTVHGMGTIDIGNLLDKADVTIASWLKRLGIEVRPHKYRTYARLGAEEDWKIETVNGEQVKTHIIVPDEDLVRLIFFTIGDGSVGDYTIQIHQTNDKLFPTLHERMQRYGKVFVDFYDANGGKVTELKDAYKYRLTLNRSEIARLISYHKKWRFDTIQFALANKKLAVYAITSLWDADGSIPADKTKGLGFRGEITQSYNPESGENGIRLLKEMRDSLEKHWKIRSNLRPVRKGDYKKSYETKKPRYILHISQNDLSKFAKELGTYLEHPSKRNRMLKIIENPKKHFAEVTEV